MGWPNWIRKGEGGKKKGIGFPLFPPYSNWEDPM
jgi:hypothetical protein